MYSLRVASTSDQEFPPAATGVLLSWERLTEVLRREASPAAAALFAEPVADPRGGHTHWHVTTNLDPTPLARLTPAQRAAVLARMEQLRGAVLACADRLAASVSEADVRLAQTLRVCVVVPDPERHIFSVGGEPLLVAWGRRTHGPAPREARVTYQQPFAPAAGTPPAAALGAATKLAAAKAARPQAARDWSKLWPWLAWLAFAGLAMAVYYHLLAACAIAPLPFLDRCEASRNGELGRLLDRNDALLAILRNAEKRAAQTRGECRRDKKAEATGATRLGAAPKFIRPSKSDWLT